MTRAQSFGRDEWWQISEEGTPKEINFALLVEALPGGRRERDFVPKRPLPGSKISFIVFLCSLVCPIMQWVQ